MLNGQGENTDLKGKIFDKHALQCQQIDRKMRGELPLILDTVFGQTLRTTSGLTFGTNKEQSQCA